MAESKTKIKPLGFKLRWLDARERAKAHGGLPSYLTHHEYLENGIWRELGGYYSTNGIAWAREVIAYPKPYEYLRHGNDIVDGGWLSEKWILPASCIPLHAFERGDESYSNSHKTFVGLLVNPEIVEVNRNRIVILADPKNVSVIHAFLQSKWGRGPYDETTKFPINEPFLSVNESERNTILTIRKWDTPAPEIRTASFDRVDGAGVRPISLRLPLSQPEVYGVSAANDRDATGEVAGSFRLV